MNKIIRVVQTAFGIPWVVFGVQHFMYADFVAKLVPAYFPARLFLAYFTGAAMLAAGMSLIANIKARLAALLLGAMLLMFILLIHIPKIAGDPSVMNWTRAMQDAAIASVAFILAGALSKDRTGDGILNTLSGFSRYAFALLLIIFGLHQFLNLDFLVTKAAPYLPLRMFWVYITGSAMVITAVSIFTGKKTKAIAFALGIWMLLMNLLLHIYRLGSSPYDPIYWIGAMLDLAITCGAFILASKSIKDPTELSEL
jgi:uncharacterized membrane protein YphA (DoxX/SURF4 family)